MENDIKTESDLELLGAVIDEESEDDQEQQAGADGAEEELIDESQPEPESEPDPPKRDSAIPRARFDEVNAKLHAAREEAEQLRAALAAQQATQQAAPAEIDLDALEDAHYDAIEAGDKEAARKIRSQINAEIYARAKAASEAAISQRLDERESQAAVQRVVADTYKAYPFLDIDSAEANQDAIADVVGWIEMYKSNGYAPADALKNAVARVAPHYVQNQQATKDDQTPPPVDRRKQQALATAARTAGEQPPRFDAGVGNRTIPVSNDILSNPDKWAKGSEADRLRLLQAT